MSKGTPRATVLVEFFDDGVPAEVTVSGGETLSPGKLNRAVTRIYRAIGRSKAAHRATRRIVAQKKEKEDAAGK